MEIIVVGLKFMVSTYLLQEWHTAQEKFMAGWSLWDKLSDPAREELHIHSSG
jgi:hypothetical protein